MAELESVPDARGETLRLQGVPGPQTDDSRRNQHGDGGRPAGQPEVAAPVPDGLGDGLGCGFVWVGDGFGSGVFDGRTDGVAVGVVEGEGDGVPLGVAFSVSPANVGCPNPSTGIPSTAFSMYAFQIMAGNEPPVTAIPRTCSIVRPPFGYPIHTVVAI